MKKLILTLALLAILAWPAEAWNPFAWCCELGSDTCCAMQDRMTGEGGW